jgi:CheY-like chemotaxis protein
MATTKPTILIVDDEPLILDSLSALLSGSYNVLTAEEGVSGLSKFCEKRPSLVLLDINLPFINGIEILARIREMDRNVPIIMMTGRNTPNNADWLKRCAELGISCHLIKPISPETLLREIENALGSRKSLTLSSAIQGGLHAV